MRIRLYPVLYLFFVLAIGFPLRVFTDKAQYKPGVPVIDYIEKERPQESVPREIKTLQEPGALYRFTLSPEFLASLLSFLVLFLATYIYFKYVRSSHRLMKKHHEHRHKSSSQVKPKPSTGSLKGAPAPPREPQVKEAETQKEEATSLRESEEDVFEFQDEEPTASKQPDTMEQLKTERLEHARRIYHLLDRL